MRALAAIALAGALHLPPGYNASVYASGLKHPTAMAFRPNGVLYVTEDVGRVVAVAPGTRRPRTVLGGVTVPLGLVWLDRKTLVVSAQGRLIRVGIRANGSAATPRTIVGHLPFGLHQQDNVLYVQGRLIFGNGSTCNACAERDRRSAAVLSVRPDGNDLRIVARGMRNPYGLVRDPRTGRIYVSVNGRDDVDRRGDPEPAEMVVELRQGRNYGWPKCWPSARLLRIVGLCRGVTPPVAYLEPHASADGMAFWRGRLYVAEWGQYDSNRFGRRVVAVRLTGPQKTRVSVFGSGFDHPLALAVDRHDDLLVADWGRGVIYRIRAPRPAKR
jgi:glucose/arabinose dehydrogenase